MKTIVTKVRAWLSGKKTYIGLIAGTVYAFLVASGVVENSEYVWAIITLWTGIGFREALNK